MSLISIDDISIDDIKLIINKSLSFKHGNNLYPGTSRMDRYIFAILFFESSTRTKMSFEAVIYKNNGKILNYEHHNSSSNKGETFEDTIKTIDHYCDLFIIRHHDDNIFDNIKSLTTKPVINAGNGSIEHPTQALIDITTIVEHIRKDEIDIDYKMELKILLVGDLLYSRTINSFVKCLHKIFPSVVLCFLSSNDNINESKLNPNLFDYIKKNNISCNFVNSYDNCISTMDFVYITRCQIERHNKLPTSRKDIIMNENIINKMKDTAAVLHPFPRNNELAIECDNNKRAIYFKQIENGLYVRNVILHYCLGYIYNTPSL
jgi:aspartate carbamoyltransferase